MHGQIGAGGALATIVGLAVYLATGIK